MRMCDMTDTYNKVFPRQETKPIEVVETPVGDMVVDNEDVKETPVVMESDGGNENGNDGVDNGLD